MELDNLILEKIKTTRIYGVTKPSIVKEILCIPEEVNIKKLALHIDECYDTFYIKKNWSNKQKFYYYKNNRIACSILSQQS